MHSIQKIIENQDKFKDEILNFFLKEQDKSKKKLNKIKSSDNYIEKEVRKLKNKFKKVNPKKYIDKLFFLNSKKNTELYVWWDEENQEAKILKYEKR